MSVGKEWEIPLRQTQKFCPENCFCCGNTKNAYTEKSLFARHGPFSQVLSHILDNFTAEQAAVAAACSVQGPVKTRFLSA